MKTMLPLLFIGVLLIGGVANAATPLVVSTETGAALSAATDSPYKDYENGGYFGAEPDDSAC